MLREAPSDDTTRLARDALALIGDRSVTGKLYQALELGHRHVRAEAASALAPSGPPRRPIAMSNFACRDLPAVVQSLGLGEIRLNSYLNQPLDAEIDLTLDRALDRALDDERAVCMARYHLRQHAEHIDDIPLKGEIFRGSSASM